MDPYLKRPSIFLRKVIEEQETNMEFFWHSFVSLIEIKNSLDFAKARVKPDKPKIVNPKSSNELIGKIIKLVVDELPLKKKLWSIRPQWPNFTLIHLSHLSR